MKTGYILDKEVRRMKYVVIFAIIIVAVIAINEFFKHQ